MSHYKVHITLMTFFRHKFEGQCVTLTFAERNRLALSLSGNKPLSAAN